MRLKIIALFSLIVILVGGLGYGLSRAAAASLVAADPAGPPRALAAATAQLQVEGFAVERWIAARALEAATREPFQAGTPTAKQDQATAAANKIADAAASASELSGVRPALVAFVDETGKVLGRDRSTLMRGDDLAKAYPSLAASLASGATGTDVWVSRARNETFFASFAPIRADDGKVVGALIFASLLNDERLTNASDRTSGHPLAIAVRGESGLDVVARSAGVDDAISGALAGPAAASVLATLDSGKPGDLAPLPAGYVGKTRTLEGYGDGKRAVVVAVVKPSAVNLGTSLLWPALGAIVFGLVLVGIGGVMLDAYLSKPIGEIEEGLLAIMNGHTHGRLEIEHAELGGIVFRINSLLNQLFGVSEDDGGGGDAGGGGDGGDAGPGAGPPA